MKRRYILTGTPGSGKTVLIRALENKNYTVVSEAATDVIALEQAHGCKEPWKSADFIDKIVDLQKQRYVQADHLPSEVQFFDRSPVCTYALCQFLEYESTTLLLEEIEKRGFEKRVFFVENLGFVEKTDARKISLEDALRFEKMHLEAYAKFGYDCIKIAPGSVQERLQTIMEWV